MSDLLTHWAVWDDTVAFARADERMEPALVRVLLEAEDAARLGAISRGGGWWANDLIAQARAQAEDLFHERGAAARRRLAFALGGVIHYPADLFVKPLFRELRSVADTRTVSAYYDIEVFREVYGGGRDGVFGAWLLQTADCDAAATAERFVRALFQRTLLACHTLSPPREGFAEWLDAVLGRLQPLYVDVDLYCRVWAAPDPALVEALGVRTRFYRADDPAVALARALRRGETQLGKAAAIDAAVANDANRGAYGRAVALAVALLRQISDWWRDGSPPLPSAVQ